MSNVAGAQAQAKRFAHQSLDVEDIRDNIQDLGNSVGDMATRQYERAHDTVSDALRETSGANSAQSTCRHRHRLGPRLPLRPCQWRTQQAEFSALVVNPQLQSAYFALLLAAAILLPALFANPAWAATGSTSIERAPSTWESGSGLRLPQERLDTGTPIEPHTGKRLSSSANASHSRSH